MGSYYVSEEIIDLKIANAIAANPGGSSYLVYTAQIGQSGTSAPTDTVLESTVAGNVVWTRNNTGRYLGTANGQFPEGRTIFPNMLDINDNGYTAVPITDANAIIGYYVLGLSGDGNGLFIQVFNDSFVFTDLGTLVGTAKLNIDVKIYPL